MLCTVHALIENQILPYHSYYICSATFLDFPVLLPPLNSHSEKETRKTIKPFPSFNPQPQRKSFSFLFLLFISNTCLFLIVSLPFILRFLPCPISPPLFWVQFLASSKLFLSSSSLRGFEEVMTGGGDEQRRSLFGISLTDRPRWQQFLICSSGFFFGYLVNGICEVSLLSQLHLSFFLSSNNSNCKCSCPHLLMEKESIFIALVLFPF